LFNLAADSAAHACLGLRYALPEVSNKNKFLLPSTSGGAVVNGKMSSKPKLQSDEEEEDGSVWNKIVN